jgi:DnaJ-domain-containing protein 1
VDFESFTEYLNLTWKENAPTDRGHLIHSRSVQPLESASGTLQKSPAVNLLVYALEKRLTGVMRFSEGSDYVAVTFRDGWIYGADSSQSKYSLSQVLEEERLLPPGVGESSFVVAQNKRVPHGQHLVDSGILSKDKLAQALRAQLTRKLSDAFLMSDGASFSFVASEVIVSADSASLDPLAVAWAGLRQRTPWTHIAALMTRIGTARLQLVSGATPGRFGFTGDELAAFQMLQRGPLSVSELAATRAIGASPAQVFAYALIIGKSVTLVAGPAQGSVEAVPPSGVSSTTPQSVLLRGIDTTSYRPTSVAPLGAPFGSTPSPGPIAFARFSPAPPPVERSAPPPSVRGASLAPGILKTPNAPTSLSLEDAARAKTIQERVKTIEKQNYFEMLGLDTNAGVAAVGEAYFAMAKEWHPDRVAKSLEFTKSDCARVFSLLTEAQRTLVDPVKRAEYMELIKEGSATPEAQRKIQAVLEAVAHFQRAEVYLKARDWGQAEPLLRLAVELDPKQADYVAALTWVEAQKPDGQSKDATQKLIAALGTAISLNDKCERAYLYRAALHKRLDNQRGAYKDFLTVTELNPRNIDAAREVRLFNMRGKPSSLPPTAGGGGKEAGLLSKLFKK